MVVTLVLLKNMPFMGMSDCLSLWSVASVASSTPSPLLWTSVYYFFTSLLASRGLSDWRRRRNFEQYVRKGKRKERKSEGNEIFEKKGRRRERNVMSV